MRNIKCLALWLLASSTIAACFVEDDPSSTSLGVINPDGLETEIDSIGRVFLINANRPGDDRIGICTGTLVSPTMVLTAQHCVSFSDDDRHLTFGFSAGQGSRAPLEDGVLAKRVYIYNHPGTPPLGQMDLAILELERALDIEPMEIHRPGPYLGSVVNVGFGCTTAGPGNTNGGSDADKHFGVNDVVSIQSNYYRVEGNSVVCSGDSGGPALQGFAGGFRQVGVHSRGDRNSSSSDSRIDMNWFDSIVESTPTTTVAPPTNLRSSVYSSTALELFWDRSTSGYVTYVVNRDGRRYVETDGSSLFESGLQAGRTYRYSIQAKNAQGLSDWQHIEVTTNAN